MIDLYEFERLLKAAEELRLYAELTADLAFEGDDGWHDAKIKLLHSLAEDVSGIARRLRGITED